MVSGANEPDNPRKTQIVAPARRKKRKQAQPLPVNKQKSAWLRAARRLAQDKARTLNSQHFKWSDAANA